MEKTIHLAAQKYLFFARWFSSKTTREDLEEYLNFIRDISPLQGDLLLKFKGVLEEWLTRQDTALELPREYTKLFHLPDGVKPYESVYRGEDIRLMQDPWVEVKKFYAERGWYMEKSDYPEDHIAVELSFMGHLLAEGENQDAGTFFREHIITWVPQLMKDIINNDYACFYGTAADFCRVFLEAEKQFYQENNT